MELTGAALRGFLPSPSPGVARGRRRRRRPARVACARGGFAEEGHLRYYEAAVARDLSKVRAMGLVAGDPAKEKVLSEATDLLLQELNQVKDEEYDMKKVWKEEKAAVKALKKQQKEAKKAAAVMICEDGSSSESSESGCEEEQSMEIGQGTVMSTVVPEVGISECQKAARKAMKKMEKEQKKAAKKAMKKKKEAKKTAMAVMNDCMDEDSSSCSSESSESGCQGEEVVRTSRCATIVAPQQQPSPSTVFPIILPQIPESVPPPRPSQGPPISSDPPRASIAAAVQNPTATRIEVCMGGKCKKSGSPSLLQELEKKVGTGGAVVGCKCLGKCGLGPNVRLRSGASVDGSVKRNPLYIGVGLEDVDPVVAGLYGGSDLGVMTPAS